MTHYENDQNIIKEKFMKPFGMKLNDKMSYEKFCKIMREDKAFNEVN